MRMSDAIGDMVAYSKLTDSVIQMIMISDDINLKKVSKYYTIIQTFLKWYPNTLLTKKHPR